MWNAVRLLIYLTIALPPLLLLFIYIANTQARMRRMLINQAMHYITLLYCMMTDAMMVMYDYQ